MNNYFRGSSAENNFDKLLFRLSVVGLSPWRPGLDLGPVYVEFVVYEVVLRHGFRRVLRFLLVSVIPPMPVVHI